MNSKGFLTSISPINKILLSFVLLILSGAVLLSLPFCTHRGIRFVDALFTSTSAVCVTGLVVLDTAKDFTLAGQAVILLLIQFGGLGIMTFSVAIFTFLSGTMSIKWRFTFESFYSDLRTIPIRQILVKIVTYTMVIELIGAAVLFSQFTGDASTPAALWHSLFHSVSAFCNAGFSTFSQNLAGYNNNFIVIGAVGINIILGGLGFLVLTEITRTKIKRPWRKFFSQYSLHTKLVLTITAILIFGGMFTFLALEWNHILRDFSLGEKLLNAFFQSITCRTAGFNTVDIGALRESTLFMMIFLMFTGGSPGSIAGGIKITTMGVVWLLLFVKFTGRSQIVLWRRALDTGTTERSTTLFIMALTFVFVSTFLLMTMETVGVKNVFLSSMFEVTSAFGTVGLSTGITSSLSDAGKLLLCLVMYTGRLGPLTLITALTQARKDVNVLYPEEHVMIG